MTETTKKSEFKYVKLYSLDYMKVIDLGFKIPKKAICFYVFAGDVANAEPDKEIPIYTDTGRCIGKSVISDVMYLTDGRSIDNSGRVFYIASKSFLSASGRENDESVITKSVTYACEGNPEHTVTPDNDEVDNASGGSVSYYTVHIDKPFNPNLNPCTVEFEDIAYALKLNPMEYNIMKDLWRNANARNNNNGKPGNTQLRTYQKATHYSKLLLISEERNQNETV